MSKRKTFLVLLAIIGLGTFLRFYQIAEIPPGLYPDEAMNGNNALEAFATGEFKVFYPENNGREGLFINLQAASLKIFGNEPWTLRIVSAIFGTFTILGVYLLTKELFRKNFQFSIFNFQSISNDSIFKNYDIIALLSAFFLATSFWHINFSRIGFRAIVVPFFATLGLYFLLKGLRTGKISTLIFSGIFTGLGFHTYIAFRFMPLVVAIPLGWYLWQWHKDKIKTCVPCLSALFILIIFVVALPIGWYFLQNPGDFLGRSGQVSIFSAESPLKEFIKSNFLTIGMFFWQGDCNWRHNYACNPQLHPLVAIFFAVGFILVVVNMLRIARNFQFSIFNFQSIINDLNSKPILPSLTLLGWFIFMTLPATLTKEGLPHALRSIGLIPPVMILAGMGAYWFGQKILSFFEKQKWPKYIGQLERIQREMVLLFMLILLLIPLAAYRDYFLRWAGNPNTYSALSTDLLNLGKFLNNQPQDTKKYVVVNLSGADIRGIPAPAQTVMFATDTFREDARRQKNIVYVTRENWMNVLRVLPDQKVLIAFLDGTDRQLIHTIEKQFTGLKVKVPGDFVVLQNY